MSLEYVERKIVEALKLSNGNAAGARQQVIAWSLEDPELLKALTKSHLTGIVAYNIERVVSGRAEKARQKQMEAVETKAKEERNERN